MSEAPENNRLEVSTNTIVSNWLKSAALGSASWPVMLLFSIDIGELDFSFLWFSFVAFLLTFIASVIFSFPAFLLFLLTDAILSHFRFTLREYAILQNSAHILIAVATGFIIPGGMMVHPSIIIAIYLIAGLFIWNRMFYCFYKNTK